MTFICLLITAYLLGSVNFSILLFRFMGKEDPRNRFSRNPGVVNVYRQAGPAFAALVLMLDMARAAAVAFMAIHFLPPSLIPWIGLGLVIGNRFPLFHEFHGGKGVANYLGFSLILTPGGAVFGGLAWLVVFSISRKPFMASFTLVVVPAARTAAALSFHPSAVFGVIATVLFIFACHHENIRNLLRE